MIRGETSGPGPIYRGPIFSPADLFALDLEAFVLAAQIAGDLVFPADRLVDLGHPAPIGLVGVPVRSRASNARVLPVALTTAR